MDTRSFGQKLNSRKLVLTASTILVATALLIGGYISGDNWVNTATVTVAAYMATNVWQDRGK